MRITKKIVNNLFNKNINEQNDYESVFISIIKENISENNVDYMFEISLYLLDLFRNYLNAEFAKIKKEKLADKENNEVKNSIIKISSVIKKRYHDMELFILYCWFITFQDKGEDNDIVIKTNELLKEICDETLFVLLDRDNNRNIDYQNLCMMCMYISCHSPYDEVFEKLEKVIEYIKKEVEKKENENEEKEKEKEFKKFKIKIKNKRLCSCLAIISDEKKYFSFSGSWDNKKFIEDDFKKELESAEKIIKQALKILGNPLWCTVDRNMRSYNYRMAKNEFEIFENAYNRKRRGCLVKHFSCCERKILLKLKEQNIHVDLWVKYSPCNDCELALKKWADEYKGSYSVKYSEKYKNSPCPNWCDLRK